MNIYLSNETNFERNGVGFLNDLISAKVTESLNGDYILEFEYPIHGILSEYLVEDNIVKCNVGNDSFQLFRIKQVTKTFSTIKIYALHITYDLLDNMLLNVAPTSKSCASFGQWILDNTAIKNNFKFESDITNVASARYVRKNPIEAILGTEDNAMVKLFGGELRRDNFTIKMLSSIGSNNGVKLMFGKNISDIKITIDITSLFTRLIPVGFDGLMLPEIYVDSPLINDYYTPKITKVEFSDVKYDPTDENAYQTIEEAYQALRIGCNELFKQGLDKPSINIKINWLELSKIEEYKNMYYNLEKVRLGDTITANILGLDYTTKVTKTVYNVLTDNIDTFEIGTLQSTIGNAINNTQKEVENINVSSILKSATENATNLITNALGGYVYKTQSELYIMDTDDINTAQKVWRWNLNGLGYSSNGVNGDYSLAITIDGSINADFITSGKINTALIEGYESLMLGVKKIEDIEVEVIVDKQASGNPIVITDAGPYALKSIEIEGKSYQETRKSSNKFPSTLFNGVTSQGLTATYNEDDGTLSFKGTASEAWARFDVDYVFPNGSYIFSTTIEDKTTNLIELWFRDASSVSLEVNDGNAFTKTQANTKISILIDGLVKGQTYDFSNIGIQINEGSTIKEFEPYGDKPSPEFPSEIQNVEGVTNLFDYTNTDNWGNDGYCTTEIIENGLRLTSKSNGTYKYMLFKLENPKEMLGKTYCISCNAKSSGNNTPSIALYWLNNFSLKTSIQTMTNNNVVTIPDTMPDGVDGIGILLYSNGSSSNGLAGDYTDYTNIQIEEGTAINNYVPYGKWLSVKSTGKNLLKYTSLLKKITIAGVTITVADDGLITLNGTAANNMWPDVLWGINANTVNHDKCKYYLGKTINNAVMSIKVIGGTTSYDIPFTICTNDDTTEQTTARVNSNNVVQFTKPIYGLNRAYLYIPKDAIFSNFQFYVQFEEGTTATPYEPYKETTALVDMNKKNLFDSSNSVNGFPSTNVGENVVYTNSSATVTYKNCCKVEEGKSYTIKWNENTIHNNTGRGSVITNNEGVILQSLFYTPSNKSFKFNAISSGVLQLACDINSTDIKIYKGIETDDYYSFQENDTFKDGLYTQKRAKIVLDGTQNIEINTGGTNTTRIAYYNLFSGATLGLADDINISCSHLKGNIMWYEDREGIYVNKSAIVLRINKSVVGTTIEEVNAWLSANPIEVEYNLATPIEHNLNYELLELHEGYNNITTNDDLEPNMSITYLTDSKLNAQYATKSELKFESDSIKLSVSGEIDALDRKTEASLEAKVGRDENNQIISMINASADEFNIDAKKLNLNGVVTANENFKINTDGSMEAKAGKFGAWQIDDEGNICADREINGVIYRTYIQQANEIDGGNTWAFSTQKSTDGGKTWGGSSVITSDGDILTGRHLIVNGDLEYAPDRLIPVLYNTMNSGNIDIASGVADYLMSVTLGAGRFIIVSQFSFSANASGLRRVNISTTQGSEDANVQQGASPVGVTRIRHVHLLNLTKDTKLFWNVYQQSGSTLTCSANVYIYRIQ